MAAAALGAQVLLDLAHLQVPPHLALEARLPVLAHLLVKAHLLVQPQPVVEARLLDLAHLVVEARLPVELRLSRQSFSAAMARSTPKPRATYDPVPRSR